MSILQGTFRNLGPLSKRIYVNRICPNKRNFGNEDMGNGMGDIYQGNNRYLEDGREYADQYIAPRKIKTIDKSEIL